MSGLWGVFRYCRLHPRMMVGLVVRDPQSWHQAYVYYCHPRAVR